MTVLRRCPRSGSVDPADGTVYALPDDDEDAFVPLHRNVESLVRSLLALREFSAAREEGREYTAERMRADIEAFDPLPFAEEDSEWNRIHEEMLEGTW